MKNLDWGNLDEKTLFVLKCSPIIVYYFLDFQDMREVLGYIKKPMIDFSNLRQVAQSEQFV